ncbi:MAG: hypothetical protein WC352_06140 [Candidatus Omnitrophota bacterium]|jgi:hypothetical protein
MKKLVILFMIPVLLLGAGMPAALAADTAMKAAGKSVLIPGWGQYQNGEFDTQKGKIKVAVMAAIEVAAIVTTGVVGGICGAPQVWIGIGLFIANHVWSSLDAYMSARPEPCVNLRTVSPAEKSVSYGTLPAAVKQVDAGTVPVVAKPVETHPAPAFAKPVEKNTVSAFAKPVETGAVPAAGKTVFVRKR